jgi:hypothetical protein
MLLATPRFGIKNPAQNVGTGRVPAMAFDTLNNDSVAAIHTPNQGLLFKHRKPSVARLRTRSASSTRLWMLRIVPLGSAFKPCSRFQARERSARKPEAFLPDSHLQHARPRKSLQRKAVQAAHALYSTPWATSQMGLSSESLLVSYGPQRIALEPREGMAVSSQLFCVCHSARGTFDGASYRSSR